MIYKPLASEEVKLFIKVWRELAIENGLKGIYFIGHCNELKYSVQQVLNVGVDAVNPVRITNYLKNYRPKFFRIRDYVKRQFFGVPTTYPYKLISKHFLNAIEDSKDNVFPSVVTGWDHTPRSGKDGLVLSHFTPDAFSLHLQQVFSTIEKKSDEHKIVFLKSWNEWAEGNYIEPDLKYGLSFLDILKSFIM